MFTCNQRFLMHCEALFAILYGILSVLISLYFSNIEMRYAVTISMGKNGKVKNVSDVTRGGQ